jgi:hypothetical protein
MNSEVKDELWNSEVKDELWNSEVGRPESALFTS